MMLHHSLSCNTMKCHLSPSSTMLQHLIPPHTLALSNPSNIIYYHLTSFNII